MPARRGDLERALGDDLPVYSMTSKGSKSGLPEVPFTGMSTVWGLAVVSSGGQEETLPYQRDWIEQTASEQGWTLTKVFEGTSSGNTGVRAKVREMADAIKALPKLSRPSRVLMIRIDRLGREPLEVLTLLDELRKLGVTIHTRLDGDLSLMKASNMMLPIMQSLLAGIENDARRDKVTTTYARKKKLRQEHKLQAQVKEGRAVAISPRAPYGLRFEKGYFVPSPPASDAVLMAFEMKASGHGAHIIAKKLAKIAPPLTRKDGTEVPQQWDNGRVLKLLKIDAYRGVIVDETTFYRAQKPNREFSQPTRKYEWPLTGAIRCECGTALIGLTAGSSRWYHCRTRSAHGGKSKCYQKTKIDAQFEDLLRTLDASTELVAAFAKSNGDLSDRKVLLARLSILHAELGKYEERRRRLFRAFEDSKIDDSVFHQRIGELTAEHSANLAESDEIHRQIAIENASRLTAASAREVIAATASGWAKASNDERRAMSKAVGKVVGGLIVLESGVLLPAAALATEMIPPGEPKALGSFTVIEPTEDGIALTKLVASLLEKHGIAPGSDNRWGAYLVHATAVCGVSNQTTEAQFAGRPRRKVASGLVRIN